MRRTLYLHIGSHRTATTSIQKFMNQNFLALIEQGFLYPYKMPRHVRLMNEMFNGVKTVADVAADLNARADARDGKVHSILLSDEDVSTRPDPGLLVQFQEFFDVKIVYSMRRQDLWLESWYFQNIKWQWNPLLSHCTFDEFLNYREDFHWIHFDRYVTQLEGLFGAENILLNVFEKQQMPKGPVLAFCDLLGITDTTDFTEPQHFNSSMSAEMVEFVRHLPLDAFKPAERDLLRVALEQVDRIHLGNTERQSERLMDPGLRQSVLGAYAEGNQALARRYFDRDALFLDPLPARDAPLASLQLPAAPDEVLERFVGPLLLRLVANKTISGTNANNK